MRSNPKFINHPVALVNRPIKMFHEEVLAEGKDGNTVREAHVTCDFAKRLATTVILKAQYNRYRSQDIAILPEGKYLKFVPYFANKGDRRATEPKGRQLQLCQTRQARFAASHNVVKIMGITDLDLPQELNSETGLVSFRQVILGIKTKINWR